MAALEEMVRYFTFASSNQKVQLRTLTLTWFPFHSK